MACIKKRRGRWVVDYRDSAGSRRWVTCRTRDEAKTVLRDKLVESSQSTRPAVDPNISFGDYAKRWLKLAGATIKPRTLESYAATHRRYLLQAFGKTKVRQIARGRVKAFLVEKLAAGYARNTVRIMHATLRVMLNAAVDDGVILANPADRLGRTLRLAASKATRQEQIKAFDREQVEHFLAVTAEKEPRLFPLFLLMARTGIRLGEALALKWDDIHFARRELRVERAVFNAEISTPKSGHGRTVDMSKQLTETLRRLQAAQKADKLRRGLQEMPPWVFPRWPARRWITRTSRRRSSACSRQQSSRCTSRRTACGTRFASLLLQQGVSPAYVQRQLGHASIQLTVDTYGKWLPMGNKAAVDALDSPSGSKVVANASQASAGEEKTQGNPRATRRSRTGDLLITNQLLYQLS